MCSPHWRGGSYALPSYLMEKWLQKLFGILLYGRCVYSHPFMYLFNIYLCQYRFILFYILSDHIILHYYFFCSNYFIFGEWGGVHSVSCSLVSIINFWNFSTIITSDTVFVLFPLSSLSGTPIMLMLYLLILSHNSWGFCFSVGGFLLIIFSACISIWEVSINLSSSLHTLSLAVSCIFLWFFFLVSTSWLILSTCYYRVWKRTVL